MERTVHSEKELCQAKFIINALKDGWTVNMNEKRELVFTKKRRELEMEKDNYSKAFLEKYGKII